MRALPAPQHNQRKPARSNKDPEQPNINKKVKKENNF